MHTLGRVWRRPSLTGIEVLWRWVVGIPALWLVYANGRKILAAYTDGTLDVTRLGLDNKLLNDPVGVASADPLGATSQIAHVIHLLSPDLLHLAKWLGPLVLVAWLVASSVGRTIVLRRVDARLHAKPATLLALQTIRMAALLGSFWAWWACLQWASRVAVSEPIAAGGEPELVLYFALAIVSTLGMFVLWGVVSWGLTVAPLLAMLRNLGVGASLRAAWQLGPLKGKLVEINLVMGIVKIALLVLAMVFSASPLPFETVATQGFLVAWWGVVTVLYFVASDYFHVARLVAYLELWRTYEDAGDSASS